MRILESRVYLQHKRQTFIRTKGQKVVGVWDFSWNMYHLNKKFDRKSSQGFSLITRQFVSPRWLVNQGVVVLFYKKIKKWIIKFKLTSMIRISTVVGLNYHEDGRGSRRIRPPRWSHEVLHVACRPVFLCKGWNGHGLIGLITLENNRMGSYVFKHNSTSNWCDFQNCCYMNSD